MPSNSSPLPPTTEPPSPIQSATYSGSTTQPNTPREERERSDINDSDAAHREDDDGNGNDDGSDNDESDYNESSSMSSLSRTRTRINLRDETDLPQGKDIDLIAARAIAAWEEAGSHSQLELFADIHWEVVAKEAFFKLRTSIKLKNKRCRRHIFLHLSPERISSIALGPVEAPLLTGGHIKDNENEDRGSISSGPCIFPLIISLSRQGTLVLPSEPLVPKNKESRDKVAAMRKLAGQLYFNVRMRFPRRLLGMDSRIERLCAEISRGGITSISALADTTRLYRRHRALVIEGDSLEEAVTTSDSVVVTEHIDDYDNDSDDDDELSVPPAYEEAGPSMPSSSVRRGKKRRRVSSSASASDNGPPSKVTEPIQTLLASLPASAKQFLTEALAAQEMKFSKALADQQMKFSKALADQQKKFEDMLAAQTKEMDTIRKEMDTMRKDLDRQYVYIEDTIEESVKENMEETQETIMQSITQSELRATIHLERPNGD